jgi:hypothetical protein
MGGFSNYWENEVMNHTMGKSSIKSPSVYIGLSASDPNDDGSGLNEPDSNSYSRVRTYAEDWDAAFNGCIENVNDISFPLAVENWGLITHFALFDAATGGNMIVWGTLSPSKNISSGEIPKFTAGDLIMGLN